MRPEESRAPIGVCAESYAHTYDMFPRISEQDIITLIKKLTILGAPNYKVELGAGYRDKSWDIYIIPYEKLLSGKPGAFIIYFPAVLEYTYGIHTVDSTEAKKMKGMPFYCISKYIEHHPKLYPNYKSSEQTCYKLVGGSGFRHLDMFFVQSEGIYDLSDFNTSNVETMTSTFSQSDGIINLSQLRTDKVKTMEDAFSFTDLDRYDFTGLNTSNVEDMTRMFEGSTNGIRWLNFDTSKVKKMDGMFKGAKLKQLEWELNTNSLESAGGIFSNLDVEYLRLKKLKFTPAVIKTLWDEKRVEDNLKEATERVCGLLSKSKNSIPNDNNNDSSSDKPSEAFAVDHYELPVDVETSKAIEDIYINGTI